MLVSIGVAFVSATGWLISLAYPRSAACRHLVLSMALAGCFLAPIAVTVRSATDWTLFAIRAPGDISQSRETPTARPAGQEIASSVNRQTAEIASITASNGEHLSVAATPDSAPEPGSLLKADIAVNQETNWRTVVTRWGPTVYVAVAILLLCRILAGLISLLRLKRRATPIEVYAGCVQVLEAQVPVPIAVGFGRPVIILPNGFRNAVVLAELQDVLAHEAEHLRRRDHWELLIQRIAAAVFWPIVTVHLLNRALTSAREELCDNAVLAERNPAAYCQTLLAVAERVIVGRTVASQMASTIFGHGELERRITGLLDNRRDRRTSAGLPARSTFALGLVVLATAIATTRVVTVAEEVQQSEPASQELIRESPPPYKNIAWTGIPKVDRDDPTLHRGVVLGPDAKPVAGASIYAASTIEILQLADADKVGVKDLGPVRAVTDSQGRFEFTANDLSSVTPAGKRLRWETLLVATKESLAPGWLETWGEDRSFRSHWHPHSEREVAVVMRPPAALTGKLLLEGGGPLDGARVRLKGLMAPIKNDLDEHIRKEEQVPLAMFSGVDYADTLFRPWIIPELTIEAKTDGSGRFELPGLPEGFITQIEITHPLAVSTSMRVAVRAIEPVRRQGFNGQLEATPTLYGSGFEATLPKGAVLRGHVMFGWPPQACAAGLTVALANQNAPDGMYGERFKTDAEGRFEMTGLANRPDGYQVAFVGSFAAPYASNRKQIVPGADARVELAPAVPYRLKLTDPEGNPVDRNVYSVYVQQEPRERRRDVKSRFNDAERVATGVYEGIVPIGPAAVVVKRGAKSDRPAAVDPKAFYAPGRQDWTLEEEKYAFGDAWGIAQPAIEIHESYSEGMNRTLSQLELDAVVFTNANSNAGVLELEATVFSDPPVNVTLVDEAGVPVENASIERQLKRYESEDLPATFDVYGLHPERAEFLLFKQEKRGLIGTLSTKWTPDEVRVVMQPAAKVIGRFVDRTGKLSSDFGARVLGKGVMPDEFVAGRVYDTTNEPGKQEGQFLLLVPPGVEVVGHFVRRTGWLPRPTVGTAFGPLTPKPGETVDLGDITTP